MRCVEYMARSLDTLRSGRQNSEHRTTPPSAFLRHAFREAGLVVILTATPVLRTISIPRHYGATPSGHHRYYVNSFQNFWASLHGHRRLVASASYESEYQPPRPSLQGQYQPPVTAVALQPDSHQPRSGHCLQARKTTRH